MQFKYIWKEHTFIRVNWDKIKVEENGTIEAEKELWEFLMKNKFIEVKMEDKIKSKK